MLRQERNFGRNITSCCMPHTHWSTELRCSQIDNEVFHSTKTNAAPSARRQEPVPSASTAALWHHGFNSTSWASCLGDWRGWRRTCSTNVMVDQKSPIRSDSPPRRSRGILIVSLSIRSILSSIHRPFHPSLVHIPFNLHDEICYRPIGLCPWSQRC